MYLSFRLPGKFMFDSLNIMWLYPIYNAIISCLGVVIVSGMIDKNLTFVKLATVGLVSLITCAIVLYIAYNLKNLRYAYLFLVTPLPLTMVILYDSDSDSVSERISTIITLYWNGQSNPPGPAAGSGSEATGSGSGATGAGSGAGAGSGLGRGATESTSNLPSIEELLASTNNTSNPPTGQPAGPRRNLFSIASILNPDAPAAGPSNAPAAAGPLHGPAAGTPGPSTLGKGEIFDNNGKSSSDLDNMFGQDPNRRQMSNVYSKRMAQQSLYSGKEKSIYDRYPANANLNSTDKNLITRKLLGSDERYFVLNCGTKSRPDYKVMTRESNGDLVCVKNTSKLCHQIRK